MIALWFFSTLVVAGIIAWILGPLDDETTPPTDPGEGAGEGRRVCGECGQPVGLVVAR